MRPFVYIPFILLDNGSFSLLDVCIGCTETQAIYILANNHIEFKRENNFLIIDNYRLSKEIVSANIRFFIDKEGLISSFYLYFNYITKEIADRYYKRFCDFFNEKQFINQKETYTNDFENETRFANGICLVEANRHPVKIMQTLNRANCYTLVIHVESRLMIYALPNEVKYAHLKSLSYFTYLSEHNNDINQPRAWKNWLIGLMSLLLILFTAVFSIQRCSNHEKSSLLLQYNEAAESSDNYVVYVCTSEDSKKYHWREDCQWLQNCGSQIKPVTIDIAKKYGRSPCHGCCK